METLVIDTVIEDDFLKIPQRYRNKRVKVIIIDSEEKESEEKAAPRKLNFKIDETLDDVVPFSDINDTKKFARELRESQPGQA